MEKAQSSIFLKSFYEDVAPSEKKLEKLTKGGHKLRSETAALTHDYEKIKKAIDLELMGVTAFLSKNSKECFQSTKKKLLELPEPPSQKNLEKLFNEGHKLLSEPIMLNHDYEKIKKNKDFELTDVKAFLVKNSKERFQKTKNKMPLHRDVAHLDKNSKKLFNDGHKLRSEPTLDQDREKKQKTIDYKLLDLNASLAKNSKERFQRAKKKVSFYGDDAPSVKNLDQLANDGRELLSETTTLTHDHEEKQKTIDYKLLDLNAFLAKNFKERFQLAKKKMSFYEDVTPLEKNFDHLANDGQELLSETTTLTQDHEKKQKAIDFEPMDVNAFLDKNSRERLQRAKKKMSLYTDDAPSGKNFDHLAYDGQELLSETTTLTHDASKQKTIDFQPMDVNAFLAKNSKERLQRSKKKMHIDQLKMQIEKQKSQITKYKEDCKELEELINLYSGKKTSKPKSELSGPPSLSGSAKKLKKPGSVEGDSWRAQNVQKRPPL